MTQLSGTSQDFVVKSSTSRCGQLFTALPLSHWSQLECPVAVLRQGQRRSAAVADLDHVTWYREVVEPFRVVGIEVHAPMRGVAVALGGTPLEGPATRDLTASR